MDRRWIRGLKVRVGQKCCTSRRGARLYSKGIQARGVWVSSHSVTCRVAASGVKAAKSSEFGVGE